MFSKIVLTVLILALCAIGSFASGKTEAALGSEERPIVWAFVPSGDTGKVSAGAQSVADLLHAKTGLFFKTLVATEYAGVIEALRSSPPTAQMASLATFAYVMAADMGVCKAVLVSVRNKSAFYNGQFITRADSGITKLADLKGKTFARVDALSTSGWMTASTRFCMVPIRATIWGACWGWTRSITFTSTVISKPSFETMASGLNTRAA